MSSQKRSLELTGRKALVTGASSGLGLASARALALAGAQVILVARNQAELEARAAELRAAGCAARAMVCDVTDDAAIVELFLRAGDCEILVNSAGTNIPQDFLEVDAASLDRLLALNVRALFRVSQSAARRMVVNGRGVIINISSQMGHVGAPRRTVYCMSKHAVEGLTKSLAVELGPLGVRVVAIAPGFVPTPLTQPFLDDEVFRSRMLERIPLGRFGNPEEIGSAVVFLASDAGALATGSSLRLDGGYTAA